MKTTTIMLLCTMLAGCSGCDGTQAAPPAEARVLPPVIVLALSAEDTMAGNGVVPVAKSLVDAGFDVMSMDLPCHGSDSIGGNALVCWRERIDAGRSDIFRAFCAKLSAMLTEKRIDRVSVVGISRGGYVALTCAALDTRIVSVGLNSPVTDLMRLTEFSGALLDRGEFDLFLKRDALRSIPILLRMNRDDQRVGTSSALAFVEGMSATVEILDATGHKVTEEGQTAAWLKSL